MEYYVSQKIKEEWGKKPCEHPSFEKVYYTGAFLTVYCCTTCGMEFTIAQKLEIDEIRKADHLQGFKNPSTVEINREG